MTKRLRIHGDWMLVRLDDWEQLLEQRTRMLVELERQRDSAQRRAIQVLERTATERIERPSGR